MVFSSIQFVFLYLPIVLTTYLVVLALGRLLGCRRFFLHASNAFMLLASLMFYYIGEGWLLVIMVVSALTDYTAGLVMSRAWRPGPIDMLPPHGPRSPLQTTTLVVSLCINLGILFFFKYFNFAVEGWNHAVTATGFASLALQDVARVTLPLGISFYTFQSMSYSIDVYRGHARATRNLIDFGCYVTMYPQLVAGPIVRYIDVAAELTVRRLSLESFTSGIHRFIAGLAKKVLIANTVAVPVDAIFALPPTEVSTPLAWLATIGYALQIYFDFSGYSDMAIGLGRMLGFNFCENFDHPYASSSLREFWRRWHISLSTWFRDYLYVPLGGNRHGNLRTSFNLLVVFLLCGLWHGAEWTFVAWGLWHGLFLSLERYAAFADALKRHRAVAHLYTLLVVLVGWVLFRAVSFPLAAAYLRALAGFPIPGGVADGVSRYLTADVALAVVVGALLSTPIAPRLDAAWSRRVAASGAARPLLEGATALTRVAWFLALAFFCVCALAGSAYNPFIYFRF